MFSMHLLRLGFICNKAGPSFFNLQTHKGKIFLLLYVDNINVKGSNPPYVSELVLQPGKKFAMKDLGPLHYSLRIEVKYFVGGIHLNRRNYVVELLSMIEILWTRL